jgi:hypothetical protein
MTDDINFTFLSEIRQLLPYDQERVTRFYECGECSATVTVSARIWGHDKMGSTDSFTRHRAWHEQMYLNDLKGGIVTRTRVK